MPDVMSARVVALIAVGRIPKHGFSTMYSHEDGRWRVQLTTISRQDRDVYGYL